MVRSGLENLLTGIVLAGGQSRRMGSDKSMMEVNGLPMYLNATRLLHPFAKEVYISINKEQEINNHYECPTLVDEFEGEGPVGALISCHHKLRKPLLVLACDMPAVHSELIHHLISLHKPDQSCTLYYHQTNNAYEPMLSVWELAGLDKLTSYFMEGGRSFQKFFKINHTPKHLTKSENYLMNCNTEDAIRDWRNGSAKA